MTTPPGAGESGFSLAEVVVALGLLAGVLISMAGLLAMGNRQVHSGRSRSAALSAARHVQEQLTAAGFVRAWMRYECDPGLVLCRVDSDDSIAEAPVLHALVDGVLAEGTVELLFESLEDGGSVPGLGVASAIRATVTVRWREGLRKRSLQLATVRM